MNNMAQNVYSGVWSCFIEKVSFLVDLVHWPRDTLPHWCVNHGYQASRAGLAYLWSREFQ